MKTTNRQALPEVGVVGRICLSALKDFDWRFSAEDERRLSELQLMMEHHGFDMAFPIAVYETDER